jgi:hypothetical protein
VTPRRTTYAVLLALPAAALALTGLFHPHHLTYETSGRWLTVHVPGLLVFPLVGLALIHLYRGRVDAVAWAVRLSAYLYATAYTALDVVNGIAAGYVTRELGPGVPRPDEVRLLFRVGSPMEDVGSWALLVTAALVAGDRLARHGRAGAAGLLLLPGAWLVHTDHIFAPTGVLGMVLIAVATGALAWTTPVGAGPVGGDREVPGRRDAT